MTNREALTWMLQPGIQLTMDKYDRQTKEAINIAVKALKKQVKTPYKIKYKETIHVEIDEPEDVDVFSFHCPCCDQEQGDSDWDGHPDAEWLEYCSNCGQRIDWVHDVDLPKFERIPPEKKVVGEVKREEKKTMTNKEAIEFAANHSFLELYEEGMRKAYEDYAVSIHMTLEELRECAIDSNFDFDMGNYELVKEAFKWAEEVKV